MHHLAVYQSRSINRNSFSFVSTLVAISLLCSAPTGQALAADCNANGIEDTTDIAAGTSLDCNGNGVPDGCELQTVFSDQQVITTAVDGPESSFVVDIDGDGDLDVLSASFIDDKIAWYENTDGLGGFGPQQVITTAVDGAASVFAADLDGDGDADVLSAAFNGSEVAWYENTDALGSFGPQQIITNAADRATSVFAADLDGDEDLDVLSASFNDNKIAWYENTDGLGSFGPKQVITSAANGAISVFAADLDDDGDLDVLSASSSDDKIAWYENTDGLGTFGPQQIITNTADGAVSVFAVDLDGDGDADVLSASFFDDKIAWYENTDGLGTFGPQQVITNATNGAESVFAADLDDDGDVDVLSVSFIDDKIAWYENSDGQGGFGPQQIITDAANGGRSVIAADLDGDGDIDVLSASSIDDKIAWYENSTLNDCNANGTHDECDIFNGTSTDCSDNGVPDECEPPADDCNSNGVPDDCDIANATSIDCNNNGVPDECQPAAKDCNSNDVADDCDIASATSTDCNNNGVPDECELASNDCNYNNVPDDCDITNATSTDCNNNGLPDECELASNDCNSDNVPDDCELKTVFSGQQVITTSINAPLSVFTADLDGDGDADVLSASFFDDKIAWYENTDGLGSFGPQHVITTTADGAFSVFAEDLDGDGDLDVLSASRDDDKIAWYENTDGLGSFGPQQVITTAIDAGRSVFAVDLDGDGDADVLSASQFDDKIAWYQNLDGQGTFGPQQVITTLADFATSVFAADLDGDGDADVLSASELDDKIAWYENTDGLGSFGPQQVITTAANSAVCVFAADLDGDGDADVLSASFGDNKTAWYENRDGLGNFGPQRVISTAALQAVSVVAGDLDGDGDADVISASILDDKIAWYENLDGSGTFGPLQVITTDSAAASSVCTEDLDGDGDLDVLAAAQFDDKIAWYENSTFNDCNGNRIPDECDIGIGTSADCNANSIPDDCELAGNDCNFNGVPDECELVNNDCNTNSVPDDCEPADICLSVCEELVLNENFNAYAVGQDPNDWFDTDIFSSDMEDNTLFKVTQIGADLGLGTDSTLVNIHSHYVGPDGANISSMTYTGRMRLSDDNGGVGVTFLSSINDQPTSTYEYMRLRRANYAPSARTFHLAPPNFNNLIGDIDSGVDPAVNTWYRFRIEVDTTGPQLHIQANVWEDSQPEPAGFQIDAIDPSGLHPTSGTVGVWSMTAGSKYWDDLRVINKDSGVRCDDNNACTTGDACSSGVCIGDPIDCSSLNDVCEVGVCDTASGLCETVPASEGSLCDDLDFCTTDDACLDGICAGTQVDCSHLDDACAAGVCNPIDGTCETTSTNDGGACDDLDVCTPNDICVAGTCVASPAGCSGHNVPPECETVLFVDDSATNGFDDGSSWEDAYVNLQDALAEAAVNCGVIEIWVAQGTYKPDQGGGQTSGDRSAMFQLQDNLAIYGGFSGTETSLDQRAPETNLAVLSGDLSGNDAPVACTEDSPDCDFFGELCFEGSCIINDNTDENSGQVVVGSGTDNSAVLDGFMITAGRSSSGGGMFNNSGDPIVANCTFARNMAVSSGFILAVGGGMFNVDSNPMVTNCTFFGNSSGGNGGGMQNKSSNPILTDCTFVANVSGSHGGGMYNDSSSPALDRCVFRENEAVIGGGMSNALNSDPLVTHCTFIANTSAGNGGGIYNSGSNPILTGCAFFGNSTGGGGGGVANFASSPPMTNCLLSGNVAGSGGGIFFNGEVTGDEPRPLIINCTFSDNLASNGGGIHFFPGSAPFVYNSILWGNVPNQISPSGVISAYSIIQGAPPTNEVIDADPLFVDSNGKDDIVGTEDDDLRLLPRSPAIDAGFSGIVPVGIITDLDSHPRFVDDPSTLDTGVGTFPIVDMGAFEFRLGDCDANGVVDLDDFDTKACLVGPDAGLNAGCACVDLDSDGDVDLDDFALFQVGFSP